MARNVYFSTGTRSEQGLFEDIIIESLKIYGQDMYYLPREILKKDDLLNEDPSSRFNSAYMIEMYVDNVDGFDGQGDLFTKFGVEIRDQVTLTLSRRRWSQAVARYDNDLAGERPMEGDVIYVPFSRKLFQIMRVEHEQPFYQLNQLPIYKLSCELFEYNEDDFDTGIDVIDEIEATYAERYIIEFTTSNPASARAFRDADNNSVNQIFIDNPGLYYTKAPLITLDLPNTSPRVATAAATGISSGPGGRQGTITDATITDKGNMYKTAPTVTIEAPKPQTPFKFGNNSLYHDSVGETTLIRTTTEADPLGTFGNRRVVAFWYWADSVTGNNVIASTPQINLYHRGSDDKLVLIADSANGPEVVSDGTLKRYGRDNDSSHWNYIEVHYLDNRVRLFVDGVNQEETFIGPSLTAFEGDQLYLGAPRNNLIDSMSDGFIGYIDHITFNKTRDTEFRSANPIPNNTLQQEQDGDTLVRAQAVENFDNIQATASATVNKYGIITDINIINVGRGYQDSDYSVTITGGLGTRQDFRATAAATIDSEQTTINDIFVINPGGGYTQNPFVTITSQLINVDFEPGDTAYQTLADGTIITGEVVKYSDSDNKLHLINITSDDGKMHAPVAGLNWHADSANSSLFAEALTVELVTNKSAIEQNEQFETETDFIDFSEINPFGNPETPSITAEPVTTGLTPAQQELLFSTTQLVDARASATELTTDNTELTADFGSNSTRIDL